MRKVWVEAKRRIFIDTKYSRVGCMIENKYFTFQPFKRNILPSHNELLEKKQQKKNYNEYNNRNKQYVPTV